MSKRFSTSKKTAVGSKFDWHCAYYGRDLCRQTISDYLFFFEKFNGEAEHETF